ncbi:AIPR family protein [uncultured Anaeromusa sp.]|uniref:AIPR family protein n=1 Tax=uncultured Anaeromusa sp. TaxID=673273 RepID=UPI0029C75766|nr:AIPR family protein [uncultured Anaeromusa sp.]
MDSNEFRKDFLESIRSEAAVLGEGSCAAFTTNMAESLVNIEVLPDFIPCFYIGTGKGNRKFRVDGYSLDELDYTINLIIADYEGIEERTLAKAGIKQCLARLSCFVDQAYNSQLCNEIEISTPCSDLVDLLRVNKESIRKYRLIIFTDATLSETVKVLDSFEIEDVKAECQIWDIERLFRVCSSEHGIEEVEIDFTDYLPDGIPCLEASYAKSIEYKSYLCVMPGTVLADIYDKFGSQLLEGNVRSFLSTKVAVNKKIRDTIMRCPTMFFAFNNGISATAMEVSIENTEKGKYITRAKKFQIINGGQTTASLSNTRYKDKKELDEVYVQMKLTQLGEMDDDKATELIRCISRSSNSQNKVSDADFFATHPFHVRMEQFSRRIFAPAVEGAQYETKWFYERARGQYLQAQMRMTPAKKKQFVLQNPKEKVITKTDLAKVRNTWSGFPQVVSKGAQTNFMKFAEKIDDSWAENDMKFNERYFQESVSLVILFKHTEGLIPKQAWYEQGYRANIVTYSIALFHLLLYHQHKDKMLDLMNIWNRQAVPDAVTQALEIITEKVFYKITATDRPTINVTQWCKRDACWDGVRKLNISLPQSIESVLINKSAVKVAEKEARADQKVVSGLEMQRKVLEYSAEQWAAVMNFVKSRSLVTPGEETALKVASKLPGKLPNSYQCQQLLGVLDRAKSEGFVL